MERLEADKKRIRLIALLDTLEYLKKGGRISKAAAMAGDRVMAIPCPPASTASRNASSKANGATWLVTGSASASMRWWNTPSG